MIIEARSGPQYIQDGAVNEVRMSKDSSTIVQDSHGRYMEASYRGQIFYAANQAAQATSVALATAYTGLVLSNPAASKYNLVLLQVGFVLAAAPAAIASVGLIGGQIATGLTAHTTALIPGSYFIGAPAGVGKADASATLPTTPVWIMQLMGGFTAAALPSTTPALIDIGGSIILPPGAYVAIGTVTATSMLASFAWEEVPV
jgi:hypothetical protein